MAIAKLIAVCTALVVGLEAVAAKKEVLTADKQLYQVCKRPNDDSYDEMKALLDAGANPNGYMSIRGVDALIKCASAGRSDLVELLLGHNADATHVAKPGWTALQMAVGTVDLDVTRMLLDAGADIESRDEIGYTPWLLAARSGDIPMLDFLSQYDVNIEAKTNPADIDGGSVPPLNALLIAAEGGYAGAVDWLKLIGMELPFEMDENREREDGRDPYQEIFDAGNEAPGTNEAEVKYNLAKEWLEKGLSPDEYDDMMGATAIIKAAMRGNTKMIRLLAEHNANIDRQTSTKAQGGTFDVEDGSEGVAAGAEAGTASDNDPEAQGYSALHISAAKGYAEAATALIEAKASINMADNAGRTALMWAVKNRRHAAAEVILNAGADTRLRDNGGHSALDYARGKVAGSHGADGKLVAKVLAASSKFKAKPVHAEL